jgi:hypothetical protein
VKGALSPGLDTWWDPLGFDGRGCRPVLRAANVVTASAHTAMTAVRLALGGRDVRRGRELDGAACERLIYPVHLDPRDAARPVVECQPDRPFERQPGPALRVPVRPDVHGHRARSPCSCAARQVRRSRPLPTLTRGAGAVARPSSRSARIAARPASLASAARSPAASSLAAGLTPRRGQNAGPMASALATNALRHGQGVVTIQIVVAPDTLRVEVADEGHGAVAVIAPAPGASGGLGLRIVRRAR